MRVPSLLLLLRLLAGCDDAYLPIHPTTSRDQAVAEAPDLGALDLAAGVVQRDLTAPRIRHVFLSSTLFGANLGGLMGADAKCQALADGAGLGGRWMAWLSNAVASPATRFTRDGAFGLVRGYPVANSWDQLTSGGLRHAIDITESGARSGDAGVEVRVWTDTRPDGTLDDIRYDCGDWTDELAAQSAIGLSTAQSESWTAWTRSFNGGISAALYCFEQ